MPTQHGFLSFRVKSDLAASIEIAVGLASLYEVSSAVINGSSEIIPVENDRDKIITDLRPGVQVRVKMKRYSLVPGYWAGQSNYYKDYAGGDFKVCSNMLRFGLSYRLTN